MKKFISTIMLAVAILLGVSSCSKETQEVKTTGTGDLKLTISYSEVQGAPDTRATVSDFKPTTTWANNIKDLMILFVDAGGVVKDARDIALSTATGLVSEDRVFSNVIAGNYTAYLVANSNINGIASKYQTLAGTTWDIANVKGKNVADLLMALTPSTQFATDKSATTEATAVGYAEAGEVFLATQTGVNVIADANTDYRTTKPFVLTRAVSLFRARINPTAANLSKINFAHADASIRIRRATTNINPLGSMFPAVAAATNLVYAKQFSTSTTRPANYTGTNILDAAAGQTAWKDVRIFPGGSGIANNPTSGTNSQKFDIVLCGVTTDATYVTAAGVTVPTGTKIYWNGTLNGSIAANGILEVNFTLTSLGLPDVPTPTSTGNLQIAVSIANWGSVTSVDTEI